jgi:hypothetical protein
VDQREWFEGLITSPSAPTKFISKDNEKGELLTWEHADVVLQLTQRRIAMERTE